MGSLPTGKNGKKSTLNLKLSSKTREDFYNRTRELGTNMQSVLSAFINAYNENPEKFKITMNVR